MTDKEKVIKGLECCISSSFDPCRTKDCPFAPEGPNDFSKCQLNLMRDALALLEEQKAKAIVYHENSFTGLPVAHCPNCKRYARQFHSAVEEETHYCPWCGQAVKWE